MSENSAAEYYFVDAQGSRNGPLSETDFLTKLANAEVLPETPVWRTGEANWVPLKTVRNSWFPNFKEEIAAVPALERLNADTSLGSLFSDTWSFLFAGNHFWFLLGGGILWVLIDAAASTVIGNLTSLVSSFISSLVFLIFIRKWDRGEAPEFSDVFPLKQFFFLPWLRTLGASILSSLATLVPFALAGLICVGGVIGVGQKHPELFERNTQLINTLLEITQKAQALGQADEFPQITVETEQDADALPEIESAEIVFPNSHTLTEELSACAEIYERLGEGCAEMAELVFESPFFWIAAALSLPFIALGIFLSVRFSLATYLPLDTELGVIDSLKYSWKLTAGMFWKIFIFGFLLGMIFLIGCAITLGLGYIVLGPYLLVAFPILYVKLIKSRPELNVLPSRL